MKNKKQPGRIRIWAVLFWLLAWQLLSAIAGHSFFIPGPVEVLFASIGLLKNPDFYHRSLFSLLRIFLGFFLAFLLAALLAYPAYKSHKFRDFLKPLVYAIQSVPVASFVIMALFWMNSGALSIFICFLIVFPMVYYNVLEGLFALDPKLSQMAKVFDLPPFENFRAIIFPQLRPYLDAAGKTSMGLAWKSGTAAEIIAMVKGSIGEALYHSKIYLDMVGLLSYTLWIILFAALSAAAFSYLLEKLLSSLETKTPQKRKSQSLVLKEGEPLVSLKEISKSFGEKKVIRNFSYDIYPRDIIWVRGESGKGKTTLLQIIMGLIKPDQGELLVAPGLDFSPLFQENRLIESWTIQENLLLVNPDLKGNLSSPLRSLGLAGLENFKIEKLSGGMKRRVAIARAVISQGDLLILDEPFRDLDAKTKTMTIEWIKENEKVFKAIILVSHNKKEAQALSCNKVIDLEGINFSCYFPSF